MLGPARTRHGGAGGHEVGRRARRRHDVHEGGDCVGTGGQRLAPLFGAPCGVDVQIGLQRAPGVGAERAFHGLRKGIG